jgi:hypothetical protein
VVATALVVTTSGLDAATWKTFTSGDGGFSIRMPGNPQRREHVHSSFLGPIQENTYSIQADGGHYSVEYSDLPWAAVRLGGAETIYRRAKEGLLRDAEGVETSFTPVAQGTRTGKELAFRRLSGQEPGKARFFLVEKRLYVLVARSRNPDDIHGFLSSFRLAQE